MRFLCEGFILTSEGHLPFPETLYSLPKKGGKTATAAMIALYVALAIGGPFAEVYILSNDYDQSVGRVFTAAKRIIEASPLLKGTARITQDRIEFISTGSFIQAVASTTLGLPAPIRRCAFFGRTHPSAPHVCLTKLSHPRHGG